MSKKFNAEKMMRQRVWEDRLQKANSSMAAEYAAMDDRERQYRRNRELFQTTRNPERTRMDDARHVRNLTAELIETQVDVNIPTPKVTAMRREDEELARLIEDMLRGELDRLPVEMLNDLDERTSRIQGAGIWQVDWDPEERTHNTAGEIKLTYHHPKRLAPQQGVWFSLDDMDWFILKTPVTKQYIKARWPNVDLEDERESEPLIKGVDGEETDTSDELLTLYIGYERGDSGVSRRMWVNDTELECLEDYQARRCKRCDTCGRPEPPDTEENSNLYVDDKKELPDLDAMSMLGSINDTALQADLAAKGMNIPRQKGRCPYCGGKFVNSRDDYEEIWEPIIKSNGEVIDLPEPEAVDTGATQTVIEQLSGTPLLVPVMELQQRPLKVPYYKPNCYPVVLHRNIPVYGRLLGDSDCDRIFDQQNTTNHLSNQINEKILAGGSFLALPDDMQIDTSDGQYKVLHIDNPTQMARIGVYNTQVDIGQDLMRLQSVYDEARQQLGITDSYQGREDTTANSGKAKEFSARQAAGRLESRRVTKNAAWASVFELMFKFILAYADEPRTVRTKNVSGGVEYREFNKYDFLEVDAAGEVYWNDRFLFSVDENAALAADRSTLWTELRGNLNSGAYGDPTSIETLILFWTLMDEAHYPTAKQTKQWLEEKLAAQMQMQEQQLQQLQMQQMQAQEQTEQQAAGGQPDIAAMLPDIS